METTNRCWSDDTGKLLLRLTLGGLMLFHGVNKITNGVDGLIPVLQAKSIPEIARYGVYIGEVLCTIMILFGFWTRLGALILAFNMAVAVFLVHSQELLLLNEKSGAWQLELQGWYFLTALAVMFLGGGRYSVDGSLSGSCATTQPPVEPPPPAR